MPLTTATGTEFPDVESLLTFIRRCQTTMLDPNASMLVSSAATVEMVYAFKTLDDHLQAGGVLPVAWARAARPGVRAFHTPN